MSSLKEKPWVRWIAAVAGALLMLKVLATTVAKSFGFAKREVQARGGDVNFLLRLVERRSGAR